MGIPQDPRARLLAGLLGLLVAGVTGRVLVGPSPSVGWRINRAMAHAAGGDPGRAAFELARVAEHRPDDLAVRVRLARALAQDGRPIAAVELLEGVAQADTTSTRARYELAKALSQAWLTEEAEAVVLKLLERKPGHADALFLAAALAAARADAGAAAERLDAAMRAGCSDPDRHRTDPRFDPVRNDPRFLSVVRDRRFPEAFAEARS